MCPSIGDAMADLTCAKNTDEDGKMFNSAILSARVCCSCTSFLSYRSEFNDDRAADGGGGGKIVENRVDGNRKADQDTNAASIFVKPQNIDRTD